MEVPQPQSSPQLQSQEPVSNYKLWQGRGGAGRGANPPGGGGLHREPSFESGLKLLGLSAARCGFLSQQLSGLVTNHVYLPAMW